MRQNTLTHPYALFVFLALVFWVRAGAGSNANAVLSLDLIADGGAGNRVDDGVIAGLVSGRGTTIAFEVFATGVTTPLRGVILKFDFDASLLSYVKAENSAFPLSFAEGSMGTNFAATTDVTLPASGFLARVEFETIADVTDRAFTIGIEKVTLAESTTSSDDVTTTKTISFNATAFPDFDGDGRVGFSDFLIFAGAFGASSGDAGFVAQCDLDGDGAVGFSDFLAFAEWFGKEVPTGAEPVDDGANDTGQGTNADDRSVLEALYNATDGPNWVDNTNWLSDKPLEDWYGVAADDSGRVVSLNLSGAWDDDAGGWISHGLTGPIPSSIVNLTNLDSLDLSINELTGSIPPDLGNLANLEWLNLWGNALTGPIPSSLDNLSNLEVLWLHRNQLTGPIPSNVGNLANLEMLSLFSNELTGVIPSSLGNLANLTGLWLHHNDLTGPIPSSLGDLANLERLDLRGNDLTGQIPSSLGNLVNLTGLWLLNNDLTGPIPSTLGNLSNLETLDLDGNDLTGPIPSSLGDLARLEALWLYRNQLTGPIPSSLGNLSSLKGLFLSGNRLTGEMPGSFANLINLQSLGLAHGDITNISMLAGLTDLRWLRVANNNVTDISALGGLPDLSYADLRINDISDVSPLTGLTRGNLLLHGNPLNEISSETHIPLLRSNGVAVHYAPLHQGDFDVELVFLDDFTAVEKRMFHFSARRWTSVITNDLPDQQVESGDTGDCFGRAYSISAGERIDDLRIYVTSPRFQGGVQGKGGPDFVREDGSMPFVGCIGVDMSYANERIDITLHEMAHVLGIGTLWDAFIENLDEDDPYADTHFKGRRAIAAFDEAGGRGYAGAKVPVQRIVGAHWRSPMFRLELMAPAGSSRLSAITIQALADLGYGVDATKADAFSIRVSGATIASSMPGDRETALLPKFVGRKDDIKRDLASERAMQGSIHPRHRVWRDSLYKGGAFDVGRRLQLLDVRSSLQIIEDREPDGHLPSCGVGLHRAPIHVVDQRGRVVRTIAE